MIFYFSGTGNSLHAAKALAQEGEEVCSMADCLREGHLTLQIPENEAVGFVCPVYYGGLPQIVYRFLERMTLLTQEGDPYRGYLWFACTYGTLPYGTCVLAGRLLKKKGYSLSYTASVKMPENYVLLFEIPSEEDQALILDKADEKLIQIKKDLTNRVEKPPRNLPGSVVSSLVYPLYVKGRSTKRFYTDDQCIRCGVCASRCPTGALVMQNQRPAWVKEKCVHCLACARCGAIQYGKTTIGKKRYTHPDLRKK